MTWSGLGLGLGLGSGSGSGTGLGLGLGLGLDLIALDHVGVLDHLHDLDLALDVVHVLHLR
jgi:hypothetical protein